ncbi:MAG: cytidine deaminase [Candidatus Kerfeldbacteria bacterium]|nr:cytidine deaminase [Candidatus Kerfeldbacteria bacterium]
MDLEPGGIYRTLIERAIEVRQRAYAPYSGIHVGSAVESTAGNITVGCNIECVTLSETSHAEQNAIVAMVTVGEHRIRRIAVAVAPRDIVFQMNGRRPRRRLSVRDVPPSCGHCLQIIWEFSGDNPLVELVFATPDGGVYRTTMGAVLPLPFKIDLPGGTKV